MNMFLLLCQHGHHLCRHFPPPFGRNVFNNPFVVSCLIWAIVVLILGIIIARLVYCYYKSKNNTKQAIAEAAQKHEMDMKEEAFEQEKYWHEESKKAKEMDFEQEKFWYFLNHEISEEDCKMKLIDVEEKLKAFEKKEKKMNDDIENLKKEKEDFEKTILEEKVKAYKDIIKYIGRCIH